LTRSEEAVVVVVLYNIFMCANFSRPAVGRELACAANAEGPQGRDGELAAARGAFEAI
jgi:hypothetical protein